MAVKQAEFTSGKPIANKEAIIDSVYKAATEPAVAKAAMIMEFLKGLPGIPTTYSGDEMGMTGYEEKAKNVYLQNRNVLPWTEIEGESDIAKYRKTVMGAINGAIKDRSNPELAALNNGTPYMLEVQAQNKSTSEARVRINEINNELGEIAKRAEEKKSNPNDEKLKAQLEAERRLLTRELAKVAYMMQSANGNMTVTVFDAGDVQFSNRCDYFARNNIKTEADRQKFFADNEIESINPNNKYVPILPKSELDMIMLGAGVAIPVGTVFTNSNAKDKTEYVVKEVNGKLGIVRKDGKKIIMNGKTAKNGVMILKHIKNVIFRGSNTKAYNTQFKYASNPYKKIEQPEEGQKLSIISK